MLCIVIICYVKYKFIKSQLLLLLLLTKHESKRKNVWNIRTWPFIGRTNKCNAIYYVKTHSAMNDNRDRDLAIKTINTDNILDLDLIILIHVL